jgi:tetratricopeptide (TPR) repeat protein
VVTLIAHITKSELDRALRKPPEALAAYDYYLRGNALIEEAFRSDRGENIQMARKLYEQSLAEDPRYAPAVTGLALTYRLAWVEPTNYEPIAREYQQQATLDRALSLAQQAVALDGNLSEAHAALAQILHWQYRRSESMAEWQRAFELNPNLAEGRYAISLYHNGRAAEAIDYMKRVMRLDPSHSPLYFSYLGNAYYLTGRYSEALELLRIVSGRLPDYRPGLFWHAAAAAQLGKDQESRQAVAKLLRLQPGVTIAKLLRQIRFARQEDADRLADGLRKAGLP